MYEVDRERIEEVLSYIVRDVNRIESEDIGNIEHLKNSYKEYYFLSMALFNVMNHCITLGEEIVDKLGKAARVKTYKDIPVVLYEQEILTKELRQWFLEFITYRNNLAHEYDNIYEEEIFWCLQHLGYVKQFLVIVKRELL